MVEKDKVCLDMAFVPQHNKLTMEAYMYMYMYLSTVL